MYKKQYFNSILKDTADSDNTNGNKDYSVTPADFTYTSSSPTTAIDRLRIYVQDNTGAFESGRYGNVASLTNGVEILYEIDSVETSLNSDVKITSNGKWGLLCDNAQVYQNSATGESMRCSIHFITPLILGNGDKIIVRLNDDLTALNFQHFSCSGYVMGSVGI